MKHLFRWPQLLLFGFLTAALPLALVAQEDEEDEGDVYELSPFNIDEDEDIGYLSLATLAGTRLKTNLKDLASAITVVTEELFEDTGATDAETILSYIANSEVGGVQGNFAGFGDEGRFQRVETAIIRRNPQANQRMRGLSQAALTRNYFLTNIPFDTYNTTRTTLNRGPNSLLFGMGHPGGVINNDIRQAKLGAGNFGEISVRFGERSSHRETLDYNEELIEGRLAVRFIGLHEDTQYQQRPAYEIDKRFTIAAHAVLLENENSDNIGPTTLRASYEMGEIHGAPPQVVPPANAMIDWFTAPDPALEDILGRTLPAWATDGSFKPKFTLDNVTGPGVPNERTAWSRSNSPGSVIESWWVHLVTVYKQPDAQNATIGLPDSSIQGMMAPFFLSGVPDRRHLKTRSFIGSDFTPGFTVPTINDSNVFDNENNLFTGLTNMVTREFDVTNFTLEQLLLEGHLGFELAYDKQHYEVEYQQPYATGNLGGGTSTTDIGIDVTEFLIDGSPNPNLGRPFVGHRGFSKPIDARDREVFRATGFYNLDLTEKEGMLGWLGRHVFSGMYNKETNDILFKQFHHTWTTTGQTPTNFANIMPWGGYELWVRDASQIVYVGPPAFDAQSWRDIRIQPLSTPVIKDGDIFNLMYYDMETETVEVGDDFRVTKYLVDGNISKQKVESEVFGWQSFFLDENLVGLVGWRTDKMEQFPRIIQRTQDNRLPSGEFDQNKLVVTEEPFSEFSGNTFTWSLVGHVPYELPGGTELSVHYGESENFQPVGDRRDSLNRPLPPPTGTTKEYGFTLTLLDNRLSARFNWFETQIANANSAFTREAVFAMNTPARWWGGWGGAYQRELSIEEALETVGAPPGYWSSYEDALNGIVRELVPPELQAVKNFRFNNGAMDSDPIPGETAPTDFVAEGFEFELIGNLTASWRVFLNIAEQETIQDNTAPVVRELVAKYNALLAASPVANFFDTPEPFEAWTFQTRFDLRANAPLSGALARDGTVSQELRKWRANLVTTYDFQEGSLKGFFAGGGIRWQDEIATGYPLIPNPEDPNGRIPDVNRPFLDASELNGDFWIGYNRKLTDKIDWRIQLNGRNAFGDSDPITVRTNPDGNVAVIRNPVPQEFFLTNTFRF